MAELAIASNERVFLAGRTGSGKTFLARHLLARSTRLVVLDPKGTLGQEFAPEWNLTDWSEKGAKLLADGKPCRLRVPTPIDGKTTWSDYIWQVYHAGGVTLYIDELLGVVPRNKAVPDSLIACYTRGRELRVGVFSACQRPAWVPLEAMSEADWFFVFRLTMDEDRKRLASFMGASVMQPITDRYGFYSYHPEWDDPIYTQQLIVKKGRR